MQHGHRMMKRNKADRIIFATVCALCFLGCADSDDSWTQSRPADGCDLDLMAAVVDGGNRPRSHDKMQQHGEYVDVLESLMATELQVVVYGDSIAEGQQHLASGSELQGYYGKHHESSVFGISDSTAGELLWRLHDGEFPVAMAPEAVVLMVGTQDVLRAHHLGLAEQGAEIGSRAVGTIEELSKSALRELVIEVTDSIYSIISFIHQRSCRTKVVVMGLLPMSPTGDREWPNRYEQAILGVNSALKGLAGSIGHVRFADCGDIFVSEDGTSIPASLMPDGVNPNLEGHKLLSNCILENIDAVLGRQAEDHVAQDVALRPDAPEINAADPNQQLELLEAGWGNCSEACGGGMRQRELRCMIAGTEEQVALKHCSGMVHLEEWELAEPCNLLPCGISYDAPAPSVMSSEAHWVPGPWTPCEGLRMCENVDLVRNVGCIGADGKQLDSGSAVDVCGTLFKPQNTAVAADRPAYCFSRPPGAADDVKPCNGHGFCATELAHLEAADVSAPYDCVCQDGWNGSMCNAPPGCASGILDGEGVCCGSGVLGIFGECCKGPDPVVDVSGSCCPMGSKLDGCGRCMAQGAEEPVKDITGLCCSPSKMSASGFCCLKAEVDECGVCGGNSGTCALAAVLQVDLPAEMQAAAETNSLNMDAVFSTMARDVLADIGGLPILSSDISVNDYASTSMLMHSTAQLPQGSLDMAVSRFSNAVPKAPSVASNNTWNVSIHMYPPYRQNHGHRLTTAFFSKVWSKALQSGDGLGNIVLHPNLELVRKGVCGNAVCEGSERSPGSNEFCPADCPNAPESGGSCPSPFDNDESSFVVGEAGKQCAARGICVPLSGACACFAGYTGEECSLCMEGFVPVTDAFGRGAICVAREAVMEDAPIKHSSAMGLRKGFGGLVTVPDDEQNSEPSSEDGETVAWTDVAIKCLPFVVVGLVVLLSISFIAIGSLLYMGSSRPKLSTSPGFTGLDDPDLFLTMNPSFGQDGVRMEDFCDDRDTVEARLKYRRAMKMMHQDSSLDEGQQRLISSGQESLKALEPPACTAANFTFAVQAAREGKVTSDGGGAEGTQVRHVGALLGPSSSPAADADTTQSRDELDHAVLDVNESSIISSSSFEVSSSQSTSHQSMRMEDLPMDMSLDMSMIAHSQHYSSSDQHDLSLDLSAIQHSGSILDFPQLSAETDENPHLTPAWSQQQLHHETTAEDGTNPYAYDNPFQYAGVMGDSEAFASPAAAGMLDTAPVMSNQHPGSSNGSINPDVTHSSKNSSSVFSSPDPIIGADNVANNGDCTDKPNVADNSFVKSEIAAEPDECKRGNALKDGRDEAFLPFPAPSVARTSSDVAHDAFVHAGDLEQHNITGGHPAQLDEEQMTKTIAEGPIVGSRQLLQVESPIWGPPRPATTPHSAAILSSPCRQDMEREPEIIDVAEASLPSPGGCGSGSSSSLSHQLEAGQAISPLQDEDLWFFAGVFGDAPGSNSETTPSLEVAQQPEQKPSATEPSQVPSVPTAGCAIPNLMDMF